MVQLRVSVEATDPVSRSGLVSLLLTEPELLVLCGDQRDEAQVVVLATQGPIGFVARTLRGWRAPLGVPVVLIADQVDEHEVVHAVRCGVVAVLQRRDVSVEGLVSCVRAAAASGAVMRPNLVGELLEQMRRSDRDQVWLRDSGDGGLTAREVEVLRLLADGASTGEAARRLCYSERTVKYVLHGVIRRLHLRNRTHAVAHAIRNGMI